MFNTLNPLELFFRVSLRLAMMMVHHPVITALGIAFIALAIISIHGVRKEKERDRLDDETRRDSLKPSPPQPATPPKLTLSHSSSRSPKSSQRRRARDPSSS